MALIWGGNKLYCNGLLVLVPHPHALACLHKYSSIKNKFRKNRGSFFFLSLGHVRKGGPRPERLMPTNGSSVSVRQRCTFDYTPGEPVW